MKFEYLEIRPCIETKGEVISYIDEREFLAELARRKSIIRKIGGRSFKSFWTLYGRHDDGKGVFLATAIGDFPTKADALEIMNAILAPMIAAKDLAEGDEFPIKPGVQISPAELAASSLGAFIDQSRI